jgi:hypothetical protein
MTITYKKIASVTVGSGGASSITFSSIPQTFTDLCIKISARTTEAAINAFFEAKPNNLTTNLTARRIQGNGATVSSSSFTGAWYAVANGASTTSDTFSNTEIYLPNYSSTTVNKSAAVETVNENNATTAYAEMWAWNRANTDAITSFVLSANFVEHSTFTLYGIKKD